jgi:hypothetical protein
MRANGKADMGNSEEKGRKKKIREEKEPKERKCRSVKR